LWAIGVRTDSNGRDELVRIPAELFHLGSTGDRQTPRVRSHIRWDKGELSIKGTRYTEIRVIPGPPCGEGNLEVHARRVTYGGPSAIPRPRRFAQPGKGKPITGRPNTSREIGATARRLWKTDLKFRALSLKAMVLEVRATILDEDCRDQEIVGYKSASMEKTISRSLKDLRNPNKRNKGKKQNS
jgi:hypothetical protein